MSVVDHRFDSVVVGTGGAGLMAALGLGERGFRTACVSKVFPTRSHTGAAAGGVNAALGSMGDGDDWRYHATDTIKGGDWLSDQDAVHHLCREAPSVILELDAKYGMPFSRTASGRIYQRSFGGQTLPSSALAKRTCACADRTGHAMIHTLYGQALKHRCTFFHEFLALDLIMRKGRCVGVVCMDTADGSYHRFLARTTVVATGGAGRCYATSTVGHICTGDGGGLAARAGLPMEDMEFIQFHPTGLYGPGCLISEAVRGEGGYLVNGRGDRFMGRYAPKHKELASRDVVSRAMAQEIREGRGCGKRRDHLHLQLMHLPPKVIDERLPGISETARIFAGVDAHTQPIPVVPTAHYTMGGMPTNIRAEVRSGAPGEAIVPGLFAAGEAACVSVHGGNRLGGNSLLDILVFGKAAAKSAAEQMASDAPPPEALVKSDGAESIARVEGLLASAKKPASAETLDVATLRARAQDVMQDNVGVFRNEADLQKGVTGVRDCLQSYRKLRLCDGSRAFNTELVEAVELHNTLLTSNVVARSALERQESRGAHFREDFPTRDDSKWLRHTLCWLDPTTGHTRVDYRPVHMQTLDSSELPTFLPKARKY